jgi:fructose-1,6-bisphosphatase I
MFSGRDDMKGATLEAHLNSYIADGDPVRKAVADTIRQLALAASALSKTVADGLADVAPLGAAGTNGSGDSQHALDVHSDQLFLDAARKAGVAHYASEAQPGVEVLDPTGLLALAIDPLDGSSNIDTNISIGTIFSILPVEATPDASFLRPGRDQLSAGFFIYGPQLALVLALGQGTRIFRFSKHLGTFRESHGAVLTPPRASVFSINMSNYRHWDEAVRLYVDDCLQGAEGARGRDFNMRWNASLVAEAYRILSKGGIYLYPRDGRKGYTHGRLRHVYEAAPIAMLVEQAGGQATDGAIAIMDLVPTSLHEHVTLVFGSTEEVAKVARYHAAPSAIGSRHPLFGHRGLFRA